MVNNYTNLLLNIYWYFMKMSVYIYNFCYIRIIQPIIYIYNLWSDNSHSSYDILIIKDSQIINKFNINNNNIDMLCIKYDYVIYKNLFNEKRLTSLYNNIDNLVSKLVPCNFEFLFVVIKHNKESYDITSILKNYNNYYYVVNNYLFNESFMNWLFINHIKKKYTEYTINILDNMTNEIVLNKTQSIHLQKNDYEIINN